MDLSMKYAEDLSKLIQCPTVTNSGHENFLKMHEVMAEMFPNVFKNAEVIKVYEGDALLIKWKGKSDKKPIVMMGHQDVVPAKGPGWEMDPFAGLIKDGKVWGRGTMDCKNTLYVSLRAMEELMEEGFTPEHDIYFSSSDNEETSGPGARKAKDYLKSKGVKPAIVIDEGGAIIEGMFPGMTKPVAAVGVLEKGYGDIKFTAKSKGGHSSSPPKNTPMERLARFIQDIHDHSYLKMKMAPEVENMLLAMSKYMSGPLAFLLKHTKGLKPLITKVFPKVHPFGNALMSTTMVFTMSGGSAAPNVLPQDAWMIANMRFAPHQPWEDCKVFLEKLTAKYDIEMEVLEARNACPPVDTNSAEYKYVISCIEKTLPDIGIMPYVILGGTDCRYMQEICPCAIRWTPARLSSQQMAAMHADNENVDISTLEEGVRFFKTLISDFK